MESYTDIATAQKSERERQEGLRQQIALLVAQLKDEDVTLPPTPVKRRLGPRVLAAGTPSPKKPKLDATAAPTLAQQRNGGGSSSHPPLQAKLLPNQAKPPSPPHLAPLKPSKLLANLATIHTQSKITADTIERSTSFVEAPTVHRAQPPPPCQERDGRLALVEKLTPGPQEHVPPVDDPHFACLEPNSGIYLSNRRLPHVELQEHLRGRYYLPPSLMYSVIRPLPSNQGYDIPVPGDWVTIAVVAEMGPIKLTSTSSTAHNDEDVTPSNTKDRKAKPKDESEDKKTGGKKYMSLKLVDFGTRSRTAKAQIRGDALLSLLLFEADSWSYVEDENRPKTSKSERAKIYKGGSGGAFEACMKLHEGAVIAILNPRILKPYQHNTTTPHPTNNILAITPTSAQSIAIIGRSRDLGMCGATKRDGKACGGWCDKRVSDCCEYHVEYAVQRKRAGRAEFSVGTSGMTATPHSRKPAFDPERKWGLLPSTDMGSRSNAEGSTYVIPGHVISASGPEFVSEKIGREREEKAKRRREEKKTDEILTRLLGRDGGGGGDRNAAAGAVRKAREVMKSLKGHKDAKVKKKEEKGKNCKQASYSAEAIKRLGFDPIVRGGRESNEEDAQRKLRVLASLQKGRGEIILRPRPGKRIRSGVSVPGPSCEEVEISERLSRRIVEDSEDDLEIEPPV